MAERKIRFAVVGLGAGRGCARRINENPRAELVAVADANEERARIGEQFNIDWYTDLDKILERDDVDVVYLMTPNGIHAEQGIKCARAGKNVMITKPIATTVEQVDELIAECDKAGVKLLGQYSNRYNPTTHMIKRAIENGKFGNLILANQSLKYFRPQRYYDGWHGTWEGGGGSTLTIPIHSIDLLQWWMGPVETVYGRMWTYARDMEAENLSLAILTFKNGAVGNIVATTTFPVNGPLRTEVHGDKGAVIYNVRGGGQIDLWVGEEEPLPDPEELPKSPDDDMIDWILYDKHPMTDGHEARKVIQIITAIYRSARTGKVVTLDQ
jgi:predicted dehydrogenase